MRTADLLEEMYLGVTANKIRSGLTMLGIVIGIASVIAMLSVGEGSKAQIQASIQSIGSNLLLVMPGAQRGSFVSAGRGSAQTLTREDAEALKSVAGVAAVAPESTKRYQVTAKNTNTNTSVLGTTPDYLSVRNVSVAEGVFFSDAQSSGRAKVAVIGATTRDDLFGEGGNVVGQKIRVNGMEMTVIGVLKAKGGSGATNQDDMIIIPISTMETYFAGSTYVGTISIQAIDQESMASAQEAVTQTLLTRHKKDATTADFSVLNQADIVSTASSITDTFSALLAAIASISLLVGGIGIMNMMLTTVTERTKEIGLRQSIGAERNEIIAQFLGEAILLTVMGGAIGVLVGWGLAKLVSTFMATPTVVAWSSVWLAFGVSAVIGLVFGYYPARRAAALNPIQALRYD